MMSCSMHVLATLSLTTTLMLPHRAMVQKTRVRIQILNLRFTIRVGDAAQIRPVELHEGLCFDGLATFVSMSCNVSENGGWRQGWG